MNEKRNEVLKALMEARELLKKEQQKTIEKMKMIAEIGEKQREQSVAKSRH